MKSKFLYLLIIIYLKSFNPSQGQNIDHEGEFWGGYISAIGLTEKFAIWNDFHYVTNAFFISRHGLTYFITPNLDISGGYAYVITNTNFSDNLIRPENRIWGQMISRISLSDKFNLQIRYRHDFRARKSIINEEVIDERITYHRLRLMNALRYNFKTLSNGQHWHFDLLNEFLFNAGNNINNGVDQNRLYLLNGISGKNYTVLAGYHLRTIPLGKQQYHFRHGITIWAIHYIDFKRKPKPSHVAQYF